MSWQTNGRRRLLSQDYDETAEDLEIGASEIRVMELPPVETGFTLSTLNVAEARSRSYFYAFGSIPSISSRSISSRSH